MNNEDIFVRRFLSFFSPTGEKTQEDHQTDDAQKFDFPSTHNMISMIPPYRGESKDFA